MSKYYYIEPEVSGELGDKAIIDTSQFPPLISKLHYQFEGWLGDELLELFPCFIVTKTLMEKLSLESLSGFQSRNVIVSKSEQFEELYPSKKLPHFFWLQVSGKAGNDDFGIAEDNRLVVSRLALDLLKKGQLNNADIEEYNSTTMH